MLSVSSSEADARRFWDALRVRLQEFALSLHPDKTRLIEFGRHAADRRAKVGLGKPETFRFLGFVVTAQVGDLVQDRRRDFAKDVGSPVRASMMAQPCFLAVEKNERMSAKSTAPSTERKPPEIFWRNFIMRPSRSA